MIFLLSLAIISLYVLPIVTNIAPQGLFNISLWVVVGAGITAALSIILSIITPANPSTKMPLIPYLLFAVTSGLLIVETGGASSPFIALWMLIAFFGGIFAVWGVLPIALAAAVFVAFQYLDGNFTAGIIATVSFTTIIPIIISLLVWRTHEGEEQTPAQRSMKTLTSELSEVASKSEIIINAIGDGVIAVDSQGVIQLINPAAQTILGWPKQDAMALNYKSVLMFSDAENNDIDPSQDPILAVLNSNQQTRTNSLMIKTRSGKKIASSVVATPIGEIGSGVIAVFRDITKETQEGKEQAEFISTASHEMRTPVASIEGYLGLALNPNTAQIDAKARDFILKAHEAAQHLGRLFQDLLDVSKSEDGRMTSIPKVVDIVPFTDAITEGLTPKANEKGLSLTFVPTAQNGQKIIAPVYFVNQDNDHMREILDNLIENAIKYTPAGEVIVDVAGTDDKVIVSVKDSGLGIPAEDIPHLFQKFYRVDNMDRQSIGGTGLGLYLSSRLAEAMQGRLWVESVHGQGSTFFLELPRISGVEAESLKQEQATRALAQTAQLAPAIQQTTPPAPQAPQMPQAAVPVQYTQQPAPQQQTQPVQYQQPQPQMAPQTVQPATTVPRGESLTREQIMEKARQLEAMARAQQTQPQIPQRPPQSQPLPPPRQQ